MCCELYAFSTSINGWELGSMWLPGPAAPKHVGPRLKVLGSSKMRVSAPDVSSCEKRHREESTGAPRSRGRIARSSRDLLDSCSEAAQRSTTRCHRARRHAPSYACCNCLRSSLFICQHRVRNPLRSCGVLVAEHLAERRRHDLPRQPELVLEPSAPARRAAVGGQLRPQLVNLLLRSRTRRRTRPPR